MSREQPAFVRRPRPYDAAAYRPTTTLLSFGDGLFDPALPAHFPEHVLRFRNDRWAARVGLGRLDEAGWERHFGRLEPLPDSLPVPLAMRYHGHQFMVYNAALGDGRGFVLAQLRDGCDGRLLDLGTKGSGRTPYSRGGDGRLTLQGGVREVLAAELLEARGVPTSKAFSLYETGEPLLRGDEPSPARSSVLVRLSHSHVRFGTFQRFAHHRDLDGLYRLLAYCVEHLAPHLADARDLPGAFLEHVGQVTAEVCAAWMVAGFVHGVLNTDNMSITGESFDYGPYRFLVEYAPELTAAYFDGQGLYAYGEQPRAVLWNLGRLAEALDPIVSASCRQATKARFERDLRQALARRFLRRLGVVSRGELADGVLVDTALTWLATRRTRFDDLFFDLYGGGASLPRARQGPRSAAYASAAFLPLLRALDGHEPSHPARLAAPYFQGEEPCGLPDAEYRAIWSDIATRDDWSAFEAKVRAIRDVGALLSDGDTR